MVVRMAMIAMWRNIDEKCVVSALEEAAEKLDGAEGEVVLDFVSVRRIDSRALRAMEGFAGIADKKAIKVVLRDINVDVYKVLKLVKLASRFTFASCDGDLRTSKLEGGHAEASTK
jgi:anti-anti-sigma regulatory factor